MVARDHQRVAREGEARPDGVAERPVVARKPGNAGGAPEEDLLLQMQGMFAEYERAKILERSRRGKRHAAQRGS